MKIEVPFLGTLHPYLISDLINLMDVYEDIPVIHIHLQPHTQKFFVLIFSKIISTSIIGLHLLTAKLKS